MTCCLCRTPGKVPIQIHHLDENPSNNNLDNLAVLCGECHAKVHTVGAFSRKIKAPTLKQYRDSWHVELARRRRETGHTGSTPSHHPAVLIEDSENVTFYNSHIEGGLHSARNRDLRFKRTRLR